MEQKALVRNAADPRQVKEARSQENFQRDGELQDLRDVLETASGRRVIWGLIQHCKVFESIMETSARVYYHSGKQDVGHHIMAEIVQADEEKLFLMMRENREQ